MKPDASSESLWDWPLVAYSFVLAIALPMATLEVLDVVRTVVAYFSEFRGKGLFVTTIQNFALLPAFAICAYLPSRRGSQGAYLAALGAFVSVIVCFNFRGVYVRFGTFDRFGYSYWVWMKFLFLGTGGGVLAGLIRNKRKPLTSINRPGLYWISPVFLMLMGAASYVIGKRYQEDSMWVPTRFYALIAVGALLLTGWAVAEGFRRSYEAEGVFPR